jgi:hypothetical protein
MTGLRSKLRLDTKLEGNWNKGTIRCERDQDRMKSGGIWNIDYRGS